MSEGSSNMSGYQGKKNIPRITVSIVVLHDGRGGGVSFSLAVTCAEPQD